MLSALVKVSFSLLDNRTGIKEYKSNDLILNINVLFVCIEVLVLGEVGISGGKGREITWKCFPLKYSPCNPLSSDYLPNLLCHVKLSVRGRLCMSG